MPSLGLKAKLIGGAILAIVLVLSLLAFHHAAYKSGEEHKDAEYKAAAEVLRRQAEASSNTATEAAVERQVIHDQQVQQEVENVHAAEQNGSSPLDVLFGG